MFPTITSIFLNLLVGLMDLDKIQPSSYVSMEAAIG
jgi:hypothetical protein